MRRTAQWPEKENLIEVIVEPKEGWEANAKMVRHIMNAKEADDKRLEAGLSLEWTRSRGIATPG
jgi:hypothetical protein